MPNFKIVIVLSKKGIESVTVSAADSPSRAFGYELCRKVENELTRLGKAVIGNFGESEKGERIN